MTNDRIGGIDAAGKDIVEVISELPSAVVLALWNRLTPFCAFSKVEKRSNIVSVRTLIVITKGINSKTIWLNFFSQVFYGTGKVKMNEP